MNKKLIVLILFLALIIIFFASNISQNLNIDRIALSYANIANYISQQPLIAFFAAMLIYIIATIISFPLAWLLSVSVGLFFGWKIGSIIIIFGATIGASILFFLARYIFADFFKAKAGKTLNKMAAGFKENAFSYLLFLRLAPIFPFTLVNIVPALANIRFISFFLSTFIGIIPAVIAYTYAGEGLRSIILVRANACQENIAPCGQALSPADLITKQIIIAFFILALVALIPVFIKYFTQKSKKTNNE